MKDIMLKALLNNFEKSVDEVMETLIPSPKIHCTIHTPIGIFHFSNPSSWAEIKTDESVFIIFDEEDEERYLILLPAQPLDREQWVHCLKAITDKGKLKLSVVTVICNTGEEVYIKPLFKEAGEKVTLLSYQKDTAEVIKRH